MADDNIRSGRRVLIVSSEDTEEVYGDRLMVRRAKVDALHYRDNCLTADEVSRCNEQEAKGEPVPVYVDARRWEIEDLAAHLSKLIRDERIDVVAFDYVQEFRSRRRWQDERVKYREIASVMRHIAKDAKIAGLLFSQLTLDDKTKVPNRHNIRECRDIANAAEVILIGFEPEADVKGADGNVLIEAGTKAIFVDKVKNGPRGGRIALPWNKESACFESVADPEAQRYEQFNDITDDFAERYP
jgi:replicative DNA helicase